MTEENLGQFRARLLREERVQQMIRLRAYEIFQMRGGHAGGQAHDWFQAEGEVLAFLLANESRLAEEHEAEESGGPASSSQAEPKAPTPNTPRTRVARKARGAASRAASKKPVSSKSKPKHPRKPSKKNESIE